ncbi:hypothetical protein ACJIZ3_019907 [Penstemon smallii]|uniref:Dirigent protein n=1 Tax=Penstemon smallii TaxID=265156 RepID=A0ABD3T331_9LAMI
MENYLHAILIICLVLIISVTTSTSTTQEDIVQGEINWFKILRQRKEKVAKLHFYVQDAHGVPNATVWEVARSRITSQSPTSFGQVRVIDNLITSRPSRYSYKLGRAQGFITSSDLIETALTMNINFVFMDGKYNGSTLCVLGRNQIGKSKNRELPVVGGTGVFRMARGVSISNTYSFDPVENYGVLEYTLYVSYV